MNNQVTTILSEIHALEIELEHELEISREIYAANLSGRVVQFEQKVIKEQRRLRTGILQFLKESGALSLLTAPIVYSLLIPLVLTDIWVNLYQHICFRIYGVVLVKRSDYLIIDRHHLAYLNWIEAMNCVFCSYANGIIAFAREIASRTEQHWCPIKHALRIKNPHERYFSFLEYGDAEGYRNNMGQYRVKEQKDQK
jgi:hypothetical protein